MFTLIIFASCREDRTSVITYDLQKRDFIERVLVSGTLESANNFVIITPDIRASYVTVAEVLEEGTLVKKGDTICRLEAADIQMACEKSLEDLENVKAGKAKQEADNALNISMLQAQVDKNKVQMKIIRLDSIQMKFAPPVKKRIMELELKKAGVEEQKLLKKLQAQEKINEQSIRQLNSRIIQSELMVKQNKDQVDMLIITAPKDGMLIYSDSPMIIMMSSAGGSGSFGGKLKQGSQVYRRMPLIDLPDLTDMQVRLMVQEGLYKRIEKGQKVNISCEAAGAVSAIGVVSDKAIVGQVLDNKSKVKYYEINVKIDSSYAKLLPGLSADCEVIINHLKDTVVVPSLAIHERDSAKFIYVARDEYFTPVKVETGTANSTETIIISGLKGDETIALMEPPMKYIKKPDDTNE